MRKYSKPDKRPFMLESFRAGNLLAQKKMIGFTSIEESQKMSIKIRT